MVPADTVEHHLENIPIHSKIIAEEEEASADDEYTARSYQSLSKGSSSGVNQYKNDEESNIKQEEVKDYDDDSSANPSPPRRVINTTIE